MGSMGWKPVTLQFNYAILMDIPVEEAASNTQLFLFIENWYAYRYGGNDKNGIIVQLLIPYCNPAFTI